MRQNFNEHISKLFVRQQMKDESWESTVQSQKKNVFSFWKTLLFLFSLACPSIPTSVPTYPAPIFSLGSIRQSLLQAQISIPSVFEGIHSQSCLCSTGCPYFTCKSGSTCVPGFNSAKYLCRHLTVQMCLTTQMSSMHLILRIHSPEAGRSAVLVTVFS